ncbi:uncharacterized protein LOC134699347 [Mytilus trossulus]|uniref:uncharacterized protein LOC134699347 n=1 Tax=Mytilus trossulus TaxID=6551 RepID=UPI003007765B
MIVLTRKTKTIKYDRLVLTYLCNILLTNSYAPEPNPGPPKYPCGSCNKACTWKQKAVCCDSCDQWYHINCQGIDNKMYKILDKSNLSWECINCGMPNFSTTFFNSSLPELSNTYSELETSVDSDNEIIDIGLPTHSSSPIQKNQNKKKKGNHISKNSEPLRVLTINFQSIKNKKPEIELIIDSCKPSIIFGTETWLSNDTSPYEYIPASKYNIYTKNRKDGYGGVLLAISNQLTSTQITNTGTDLDLDTNCENVWAKISYEGNKSLYLCSYYRPPSDKGESLEQLGISLNRVLCKKTNPNIWVSGDFNLGHIDWKTPAVISCKPDASLHQQLLDLLNDNNLTQVVNKNTRNDTTLDLLCMTNPSFVNRVETLPPIGASDHDIVYSEINLALPQNKQQAHKILNYKKANWDQIEKDLISTYNQLKQNENNMSLDELWNTFKTNIQKSIE